MITSSTTKVLPISNLIRQKRSISLFTKNNVIPRNSYIANKTYPQLIWNNYIPSNFKIFTVLGTGVIGFIKLDPNIWITLGPPIAVSGYYLNKYLKHKIYLKNVSKILPHASNQNIDESNVIIEDNNNENELNPFNSTECVKILPYDESQLYNLKYEIDNEYDSLRKQIVNLVEKRIIEYILLTQSNDDYSILKDFMTNDNQFNFNTNENEIESWVTSKIKLSTSSQESELKKFIKLSIPYYDSKSNKKKRIGTVSIYLIKLNNIDWKMSIEISKLNWSKSKSIWINGIPNNEIMESDIYINHTPLVNNNQT
ncbi:uncharacterized protein KGF55_001153 [Candida pseudojiufengensis]|uniref:uncharacterized protein n=1 Tax=Candida pseudojiufengensis TaxID=497109 RepID=UPI002224E1A7|nr:uncharacterized protein KGF55_001153 [Candida pseudojiufengensis]KAI5965790.1 hypothetical protein KGF55_001153 [Candida pseudojiufengensis]